MNFETLEIEPCGEQAVLTDERQELTRQRKKSNEIDETQKPQDGKPRQPVGRRLMPMVAWSPQESGEPAAGSGPFHRASRKRIRPCPRCPSVNVATLPCPSRLPAQDSEWETEVRT